MLRTSLGLICLAPVLLMVGCSDTPDDEDDTTATEGMTLTFMSRKLYGGADDELNAAFRAQDEAQWTEGMEAFHEALLTKSFVPRAELIADEIEEIKPDFVGLQEALIISTQTPPDGSETSATTVEEDYLQILLAALDARGEQYEAVSTHDGVDAEFAGTESDVRYAERTVLLARSRLATRGIELSNAKQGSFTERAPVSCPALAATSASRAAGQHRRRRQGKDVQRRRIAPRLHLRGLRPERPARRGRRADRRDRAPRSGRRQQVGS